MEKYRSGDNSGLIANNLEQSLPMGGRLEPTHSTANPSVMGITFSSQTSSAVMAIRRWVYT